jgi:hypothetical protein
MFRIKRVFSSLSQFAAPELLWIRQRIDGPVATPESSNESKQGCYA